jgi:hypothetical protein
VETVTVKVAFDGPQPSIEWREKLVSCSFSSCVPESTNKCAGAPYLDECLSKAIMTDCVVSPSITWIEVAEVNRHTITSAFTVKHLRESFVGRA